MVGSSPACFCHFYKGMHVVSLSATYHANAYTSFSKYFAYIRKAFFAFENGIGLTACHQYNLALVACKGSLRNEQAGLSKPFFYVSSSVGFSAAYLNFYIRHHSAYGVYQLLAYEALMVKYRAAKNVLVSKLSYYAVSRAVNTAHYWCIHLGKSIAFFWLSHFLAHVYCKH